MYIYLFRLYIYLNWVVRALNADWLNTVVYQTEYHEYDKTFHYVVNQFIIIAIRHLRSLWYMANIPWLRAVARHSALRCA